MKEGRLYVIDGLRGWAALIVYFFHLRGLFYLNDKNFFDQIFGKTPLQLLVDGEAAIFLFFILSGFSLSYKFFMEKDNRYLQEAAQYRYFRLVVPVFFALLLPYILITFNLMFNSQAYFGAYEKHFTVYEMFKYSFFELPFKYGASHAVFGPVFWTIYLEFTASLIIFSLLALFGKWNLRFLLYILLIKLTYSMQAFASFYFLFLVGVIICDVFCLQKKYANTTKRYVLKEKQMWGVLCLALLILYYYMTVILGYKIFTHRSKYYFLMLLFIASLYLPILGDFFSSRLSRFLGRISFAVYLIHFPILCSFACVISNSIKHQYSLFISSFIILLVTTPVVLYVAYLFTVFIEERLLISIKSTLRNIGKSRNLVEAAKPTFYGALFSKANIENKAASMDTTIPN
ncbi:acyltransferase family protein [Legionella israelensis]|uniref:Acyltransferase family protein n=1 Tax=Legionella israelensis TaxID=454 RepID=A0A0W0WNV1_9GAMM|nr:acyltransferase [Legionella israelensis]KTD33996.1 Acyltransferase family protein [Legionella israelensis]QBS10669.1 acyltransferase [Legionella israelensis]SCX84119.1 Peptidoglycan/LPS O-acetylase OafA/YrhL, contains acyltransferase and SGNH-hydrolase domains [Legionella israelensis DSM 19235]STX57624.1 Acyltransferase family [Legionella israelensis]